MNFRESHSAEASLRAENAELRERVRQFEKILSDPIPLLWGFHLTPTKARMLGILYRTPGVVPRERLEIAALGVDRDLGEKCLDVHLCLLRKKCKPYGIIIENVWSIGYRLTAESRIIVRGLIERQTRVANEVRP